jgi:HSP20 family protein
MAESEIQSNLNDAGDKAAGAAHRGARAASETAQAGVEAERRSFGAAADAGRRSTEALGQAAQTSLKAGQDMARHSQEMARRASDQAADFWRSSMTPMAQMQGEFSRWFEQMWRQASPARLHGAPLFANPAFPGAMLASFSGNPAADLHETAQGLELCVELPGLKADEIDLSLRGDTLVLSGEKADETQKAEGAYRVSERRFGRFERSFPLPPEADRSHIDASFQDGLLRVTIPKLAEGQESTPIPVKG